MIRLIFLMIARAMQDMRFINISQLSGNLSMEKIKISILALATIFSIGSYAQSRFTKDYILDTVLSQKSTNRLLNFPRADQKKINFSTTSDQADLKRYEVTIDPFFMKIYNQKAIDDGYKTIAKSIRLEDANNLIQPGMQLFIKEFSNKFGIEVRNVNSWLSSSFQMETDADTAEFILNQDYILSIKEVVVGGDDVVSAWANIPAVPAPNSEMLPWFVRSVNADNPTITPSHNIYVLDTANNIDMSSEVNIVSYAEYTAESPATRQNYSSKFHSGYVTQVIGGKSNNLYGRGINPGQGIRFFAIDPAQNWLAESLKENLNKAAGLAEVLGEFSVINISSNDKNTSRLQANNTWNDYADKGIVAKKASNRFLITQSAGNYSTDACLMSYNYQGNARLNDAIIVVGALDMNDQIMPEDNSPTSFPGAANSDLGSNIGRCIEAWAPGYLIYGWNLYNNTFQTSSGTSFAAPIVAALASRYGNNQTRPIEREQQILNNRYAIPGTSNGAGDVLRKAVYSPVSSPIARFPISSLSGSLGNVDINSLKDEKFYDASFFYNPGAYSHDVILDMGVIRKVRGIRITLRTNAPSYNNAVHFTVSGSASNSTGNSFVMTNFTEPTQFDFAPIYIPMSGDARYIRISGTNTASWLAYSEIEVYGVY
ncbi:S8 family serine peptidase [Comamonas odontotermitis]|uniref:S8 family serine peptidase n=1 Tax=Comamonas odontotermitis TaxID=379895 RepID=UPI001CC44655|nr:S8 family serine peptidase [Comamonas odontotermitis]UBB15400.1 S8 family serine peptidase [Comamonas odontotermitis]